MMDSLVARGLVAVAVLSACPVRSQDSTEQNGALVLIQKGDSAFKAFDDELSRQCYDKALTSDPRNYEAAWKLARSYDDIGTASKDKTVRRANFAKAEQYARKAIRINPAGSKGYLRRGIALGRIALDTTAKEKMRFAREIRTQFEKTVELDPDDDKAWHSLGRWFREMATLNWVERTFVDMFLGGVPKDATVERAIECFRKAISIRPDLVNHHLQLGIAYQRSGMKDLARAEYRKVLSLPKKHSSDDRHKEKAKKFLAKL